MAVNLPMSQGDLYLLLPLAWQQYADNQAAFEKYKKSYTLQFGTDAVARLAAAGLLPDAQARGASAEVLRGELVGQATEFLDAWNLLDGYIEGAWPAAGPYKAMREAAGHDYYTAAAGEDWGAMEKMIKAALGFVNTYAAELRDKGEMPDDFAATLAGEAEDVRRLTRRFVAAKATAQQGTGTQNTALDACLEDFRRMSGDAQRIFRRQPEKALLFQQEYLLGAGARHGAGGHQGGADPGRWQPGGGGAGGRAGQSRNGFGCRRALCAGRGGGGLYRGAGRQRRLAAAGSAGDGVCRGEEAGGCGGGAGSVTVKQLRTSPAIKGALVHLAQGITDLQQAFAASKRKFTLDGRLVGDIGEVMADLTYAIELDQSSQPGYDATCHFPSGSQRVQIKATFKDSLTFKTLDGYYIGLKLSLDGSCQEVFNGPSSVIAARYHTRKGIGKTLLSFPVKSLAELSESVSDDHRIPWRKTGDNKNDRN